MDDDLTAALEEHPTFAVRGDTYRLTSAALESSVTVEDDTLVVTVVVPTLAAVVTDAAVAPVVEDDWFDTLERRLREGYDVTHSQAVAEADIERADDEVVVTYAIEAAHPETAAADAKALIEYVVGTFVQGAIPGYTYDAPLANLLETAFDRGQAPD